MSELALPRFVRAERDSIVAEVCKAFSGTDREGGVSWSESSAIDFNRSPEECAAARAKDREAGWQNLVDDPDWSPEGGIGGWPFLDAIGFRYYLPAAMVVTMREGWGERLAFFLTLPTNDPHGGWYQELWSLLDHPQRLCVKRFVEYMAVVELYRSGGASGIDWIEALLAYWGKVPEESPSLGMLTDKSGKQPQEN